VVVIAARYALQDFWWTTAAGAAVFVEEGALRDSVTSPVAVALPSLFGTVAPTSGGSPHMTGRRAQHLSQYPAGSEL
jgi:hypothetical protein